MLIAHMIFSDVMFRGLQLKAPELDPLAIISTGIPQLRNEVPERLLNVVLEVYSEATNRVLLVPAIAQLTATICVLFMTYRRLKIPFAKVPNSS